MSAPTGYEYPIEPINHQIHGLVLEADVMLISLIEPVMLFRTYAS
jgi:hypothetical protein